MHHGPYFNTCGLLGFGNANTRIVVNILLNSLKLYTHCSTFLEYIRISSMNTTMSISKNDMNIQFMISNVVGASANLHGITVHSKWLNLI